MMDETLPFHGCRVLVIEDSHLIVLGVTHLLERLRCVVVDPACSVNAALQRLDDCRFDVVLLDVDLRGESSQPVAHELAARGVPYSIMTGYSRSRIPESWPPAPILEKPFGEEELQRVLLELLAGCPRR
ncbi:MAG: response regulator [Phycisphaerales bacterium]